MGGKNELREEQGEVLSRMEEGCAVTIDGEKIEEVQSLNYLGSIISADGLSEEDIRTTNRGCNDGGWWNEEASYGKEGVEEGNETAGV